MSPAAKVLLFTDVHLTANEAPIIGLSPAQRLRDGLAHAAARHGDADHLVILGDLTHHGDADEYEALAAILEALPWPVTLMLGNHDRRAGFAAVFGQTEFAQTALHLGGCTLLCLDTLDEDAPDTHSGLICPARMAWLAQQLDQAQGPVIVLMHHHLAPTGFDGMDKIALRNRDDVAQMLAQSGKVRQIINGHIHRTIFTHAGPLPVAMLKSTCHQQPMTLGDPSTALSIDEPGGYGILLLNQKQCTLHVEDFGLPQASPLEDESSKTP